MQFRRWTDQVNTNPVYKYYNHFLVTLNSLICSNMEQYGGVCPQISANFLAVLKFSVQCESCEYIPTSDPKRRLHNYFKEVEKNGDGYDDADVDGTHTGPTQQRQAGCLFFKNTIIKCCIKSAKLTVRSFIKK